MRPLAAPLVSLVIVALLAAGCLAPSPADGAGPAALASPADPILEEHDHFDPAEHSFAANATPLAWIPFAEPGRRSGGHALSLHGTTLAVGLNGDYLGFALVDVSDPEHPRVVGSWNKTGFNGDDRTTVWSEDGKTVFQGSEMDDAPGVFAVDVSDPANPREVAFYHHPPFGAHTVYAEELGGTQYVYLVGVGLVVLEYDAAAREFTLVGRYVAATPEGLGAAPVGSPGDAAAYAFRDVYGHDLWVEEDPATGKPLAYLAYAYEGLKILDLSNPALPVEVGTWIPEDEGAPWYVHTIAVETVGDRRIAVVGSEVFENRNVDDPSPLWVLDVTDPADVRHLGTWTNPGGHGSDNLLLSAHDLRIEGGRVYLAHYHAGTWVLDLAKLMDGKVEDAVVAYFMGGRDNGWRPTESCCHGLNLNGAPLAFDVMPVGDVVWVADYATGLYAFRVTV